MAKYRQIHTHIWKDNWFIELEPDAKLFFIYLFSNERASISGIYELSKRVMSFESGMSVNRIDTLFIEFETVGKAYFQDGVVWVPNLRKYHETKSPKVQTAIMKDVDAIKNCKLKGIYAEKYGIDTLSIPCSSSSSSSSSVISDGTKPKFDTLKEYNHTGIATDDQINPLINSLKKVSKEKYTNGRHQKFDDAALTIYQEGATPEMILEFGKWWERNCWYDPPTKASLLTIADEWDNFINGCERDNPNGNKPKTEIVEFVVLEDE